MKLKSHLSKFRKIIHFPKNSNCRKTSKTQPSVLESRLYDYDKLLIDFSGAYYVGLWYLLILLLLLTYKITRRLSLRKRFRVGKQFYIQSESFSESDVKI